MGCVLMGPVGPGLLLTMIDNSLLPSSFDWGSPVLIRMNPTIRCSSPCKRWFPHCSNTARQASLRLAFCRRRQAVMARTFGISPGQSR
jgi:hypothetical protein